MFTPVNTSDNARYQLAIAGGIPAIGYPLPQMYPGGLRIGKEEEDAVIAVLRSKRLFRYYGPEQGPSQVDALEQAFAARIGTTYSVAVASGTAALICALASLAVGPKDEVIIPGYTWIATACAVLAVGAVPILVEVDESLTVDPLDVERKITKQTKAIIAVHMRGAPCAMEKLQQIATKHNLKIIEDVAQAIGGSYYGRPLGSIGDVGTFSLQYNKIITSGEGGLVTTCDQAVYQRVLMYQDFGSGLRNNIPPDEILVGVDFRMSELQGAVAAVQLTRLDALLGAMRQRKAMLKEHIADEAQRKGITFRTVNDKDGDTAIALVFYLPTMEQAGFVAQALSREGVKAYTLYSPDFTDYHVYRYWTPILTKKSWSTNGSPWQWHEGEVSYTTNTCPRTLDLLGRAVHIDISPELTERNVKDMGIALNKVLSTL